MKMHKFEVFVIDFENLGVEACKLEVERSRDMSISAKTQDTADIGEWQDSHELNFSTTPIERFNSYFATQPQAPKGGEWIDWNGGVYTGDATAMVEVKLREPELNDGEARPAAEWCWERTGDDAEYDIVAYRVLAPTKTPEVLE